MWLIQVPREERTLDGVNFSILYHNPIAKSPFIMKMTILKIKECQ